MRSSLAGARGARGERGARQSPTATRKVAMPTDELEQVAHVGSGWGASARIAWPGPSASSEARREVDDEDARDEAEQAPVGRVAAGEVERRSDRRGVERVDDADQEDEREQVGHERELARPGRGVSRLGARHGARRTDGEGRAR